MDPVTDPVANEIFCHCGAPAVCVDSAKVYHGRSYGLIWICTRYPECDSFVGCHGQTERPLGTLADKETREARKAAHSAFDKLWDGSVIFRSRKEAYAWLCRAMGVPVEQAHIAMMDVGDCYRLIEESKRLTVNIRESIGLLVGGEEMQEKTDVDKTEETAESVKLRKEKTLTDLKSLIDRAIAHQDSIGIVIETLYRTARSFEDEGEIFRFTVDRDESLDKDTSPPFILKVWFSLVVDDIGIVEIYWNKGNGGSECAGRNQKP